MAECPYPLLFSPIRLGKQWFRNRIFASPISGRSLDSLNRPNDDCIAFYEEKARGGAASVCLGECAVDSVNGIYGEHMVRGDDPRNHHAFNLLTAGITRFGSVASAELSHAGLYAHAAKESGGYAYGPVAGINNAGEEYREMPEEMIEYTIGRYADTAAFMKACGFGMVTVHMGHGWGLSQFLSSKVNTRTDRWGGTLENRCRLPIAVLDAIRKRVGPGFPIEVRLSGSEVTPMGYDLDEGIAIAKMLDGHCDLLHVSAGHHERPEVFCVTHPSIFSADSCNVGYAAAIKKEVSVPVATVGAHCDPALMEEILASGQADVIEIARALLADPQLPNKARAGRTEEIRPCLRCLTCFSNLITNGQIFCAVNPVIGRERENRSMPPAAERKTVLIAGGGIAGMQAAITCADRGHRVILCEKGGTLGGTLTCEEHVPFKQKIHAYLEYQRAQIAKRPIEVRLNTPVTPELADAIGPDVLLAALGAVPSVPPIPGMDGPQVLSADTAYRQVGRVGKRVVVLGGGLVGVELAIYLAGEGRSVTVLEMLPALNNGGNILHQNALDTEIRERHITVSLSTRVEEITDDGVRAVRDGESLTFPADSVICAMGQHALREEAEALRFCAPEFYVLGDCVTPKNILQATAMADAIAKNL